MDNRILWDIIDGLRDEVNVAQDGITDLNDVVKDLQAEAIEQIKDTKRLQDKLQEVNNDYNNDHKVHNDYEDGLLAEIKELKADNSKYYPKEYRAEADEYFSHNPKCKSVSFYMLDDCDVDEIEGSHHEPIVIIHNDNS